jgi:siroheme synthase
MGLANRSAIARTLLDEGWPGQTPAAVLIGVSHARAGAWHGTLDGLQAALIGDEDDLPGIIVVGAVAALAGIIATEDEAPDALRTTASLG